MSDTAVPQPSTSDPSRVLCDRCGSSAGNHYEGDGEHLDLCDSCMDDFADWLGGDSA